MSIEVYAESAPFDVICVPNGTRGLGLIGKLTGAAAAAVIVATIVFWIAAELDRRAAPTIQISAPRNNEPIVVEIAGAVTHPGVYQLRQRDRVEDLINAAGGLLPESDTSGINRAAPLIDGQRVTIPFLAGAEKPPAAVASPQAQPLLNINTATVEELDELPGIGEVRAAAIVNYRNRFGPFQSIEELLFVDGISEGLLEELRPFITVTP